jgi:hypothetical protein
MYGRINPVRPHNTQEGVLQSPVDDEVMAKIYPSEQTYTISPTYIDDLTRTIGALQQLQVLMAAWSDPTLADVAHLVGSMQQDFGPGESLEHVIQALVGCHLALQLARLRRVARQCFVDVLVVASLNQGCQG